MGQYDQIMERLRASFGSGKTKSYEWRVAQLTALLQMLRENEDKLCDVLYKDLHKPKFETSIMELAICTADIADTINNLSTWMKPEKVHKDSMYLMDTTYIQHDPLGVSLIIGAWNYPIQLVILPLVGAIAAGNCAIVKPSEISEHTAKFLEETIPKYLDQDCIQVINGGVAETTELLKEKFDLIFYTGHGTVARIIMEAAAKHLTPVVLELGGKSPVYIDNNVDMKTVTKRVSWGKFANAGQTCIAPDYILCPAPLQDQFIAQMKETLKEFYTENPQKSDSFARIVSARHFSRIQRLKQGGNIAIGGEEDEKERFIAPTVLRDVKLTDPIMQEEIFGPLLPIIPVKDHTEAIGIINDRDKPLSLYVFSSNQKIIKDFREKTSSGAFVVNDTVVHGGLPSLPFGGVGGSGFGAYHGKHSFDVFSHKKAVMERPIYLDQVNNIRYPPYTETKLGWLRWILTKKVKRRGMLSFLPIMVLGSAIAMVFKTLGASAESMDGLGSSN